MANKNKGGDCFQVAANLVTEWPFEGTPVVVHGLPFGRGGSATGKRFAHAWVECDGLAYDFSNGLKVVTPIVRYYRLGDIKPEQTFRYTREQVIEKLLATGIYGPWDFKSKY